MAQVQIAYNPLNTVYVEIGYYDVLTSRLVWSYSVVTSQETEKVLYALLTLL